MDESYHPGNILILYVNQGVHSLVKEKPEKKEDSGRLNSFPLTTEAKLD